MTKEAMITYNTLHSAERNQVVRVASGAARSAAWADPALAGGLAPRPDELPWAGEALLRTGHPLSARSPWGRGLARTGTPVTATASRGRHAGTHSHFRCGKPSLGYELCKRREKVTRR